MTHPPYYPQPEPKRKKRKFTWFILVVNALFLIWVISGAASAHGHATGCGTLSQADCDSAKDVGTSIGVFLIVAFWAFVDIILGIMWLVTRKRQPAIVYVQQQPYPQQYR